VTRIVAGTLGGRRLAAPPGRETRPTSDRVREALFSTLATMIEIDGSRFVDLYAGSGAVGLEAASRGASAVLLVESQARAARTIRENIALLDLGQRCQLATGAVATVLASAPAQSYDVVFGDPPYELGADDLARMMVALVGNAWLAPGAVLAVERSTRSGAPRNIEGVTPERARRYGESTLWYFRRS
jgi:16S rRNA (guanine966-N2)-methyltransferase